jgi:hypothetical protein
VAEQEGVIKFSLNFRPSEQSRQIDVELHAWRALLHGYGLIGQVPHRYEGFGFGNLSQREAIGFSITATQTGGRQSLSDTDYAWVTAWSLEQNALSATGLTPPSSESLTHAAIYEAQPEVRFVFHIHSPDLWTDRAILELPETAAEIPYGTVEMALALKALAANLGDEGIAAMAGHEDGIVSWSKSAVGAGLLLMNGLQRLCILR